MEYTECNSSVIKELWELTKNKRIIKHYEKMLDELKVTYSLVKSLTEDTEHKEKQLKNIIKVKLSKYIPNRFGIESGYVMSLEDIEWISKKMDCLFTIRDTGYPIMDYKETTIYPIESIAGFLEIESKFNQNNLLNNYLKIKELKHRKIKKYVISRVVAEKYNLIEKKDDDPLKANMLYKWELDEIEPRYIYFAYESEAGNDPEKICSIISELGKKYNIFLNGMYILGCGYFKSKPSISDPNAIHRVLYNTNEIESFIMYIQELVGSLLTYSPIPNLAYIPIQDYAEIKTDFKLYTGEKGG